MKRYTEKELERLDFELKNLAYLSERIKTDAINRCIAAYQKLRKETKKLRAELDKLTME